MSLILADARHIPLVDRCVQCVATSPPYFGLRDYGISGQIGLESTPDDYVQQIVAVFREVRRVLKDDGTVWLNLGDSYCNAGSSNNGEGLDGKQRGGAKGELLGYKVRDPRYAWRDFGIKHKDPIGIPWRVAFALQADGWYLRSDIIWAKKSCMPESVTDRPTRAHEYLFLLAKSERYYYDYEAIREDAVEPSHVRDRESRMGAKWRETKTGGDGAPQMVFDGKRNKRSVWTINPQHFDGAHFATMPEALVEPCILAGSRLGGKRCDCDVIIETPTGSGHADDPTMRTGRAGFNRERRSNEGRRPITRREQRDYAGQMKDSPFREQMAVAAGSAFAHYIRTDASGARPVPPDLLADWLGRGWLREPAPCSHPEMPADIILDPFMGSGTVGAVAERFGRRWVGTDLNPEYHALAQTRTAQRGLRFDMEEA